MRAILPCRWDSQRSEHRARVELARAAALVDDLSVLIFILLGWVPWPLLLALAVVMWLTVVELLEWRPHYAWWVWWLLLVFMTNFVGYLILRAFRVYQRYQLQTVVSRRARRPATSGIGRSSASPLSSSCSLRAFLATKSCARQDNKISQDEAVAIARRARRLHSGQAPDPLRAPGHPPRLLLGGVALHGEERQPDRVQVVLVNATTGAVQEK